MENFIFYVMKVTSLYKGLYNTLLISLVGQMVSNFIHEYRFENNQCFANYTAYHHTKTVKCSFRKFFKIFLVSKLKQSLNRIMVFKWVNKQILAIQRSKFVLSSNWLPSKFTDNAAPMCCLSIKFLSFFWSLCPFKCATE